MNRWSALTVIVATMMPAVSAAHDLRAIAHPVGVSEMQAAVIGHAKVPEDVRGSLFSIIGRAKIWPRGQLSFCFGPAAVVQRRAALIDRIMAVAQEWVEGTKLVFDTKGKDGKYRPCFSGKSADIRINIAEPKNSSQFTSLVGQEAATHNLKGWSFYSVLLPFRDHDNFYLRDEVFRFYVLHEIGHAVGVDHEHQRLDCDFDYTFIRRKFGFTSERQAKKNMEPIASFWASAYPDGSVTMDAEHIKSPYDNYSVMKYNLSTSEAPSGDDPRVYKDGTQSKCYRAEWVSDLTKYDHAGIQAAYAAPGDAAGALVASAASSGLSASARRALGPMSTAATGGGLMSIAPSSPSVIQVRSDFALVRQSRAAMQALEAALTVSGH